MWRAALVLGLLTLQAAAVRAQPDGSERFERAGDLRATGKLAEAAAAYEALADSFPADVRADDALFAAAQLYEEKLGDPARAAALYQRLVRDYPDSRVSLAASRRLELLRDALGPTEAGADAVAEMNRVLHDPDLAPADAIAAMLALIAANPEWPGLPEAILWLGHAHRRNGEPEQALARYREIGERWPESPQAFEALLTAAEVAAHFERFDEADAALAAVRPGDDPGRRQSLDETRAFVARERLRATLYRIAFAVWIAVLVAFAVSLRLGASGWRNAARGLVRPPLEVVYMVPVAILLGASALTGHQDVAPAVGLILGGGLLVTWLSGAGLAIARRRRLVVALHAVGCAAGVIAVAYIALHRTRLLDLIVSTVRFGPEV